MKRFDGKVAVVTGGARGIGAETVRKFVDGGGLVAICDIMVEEGRELERELCGATIFIEHDVRSQKSWDRVVATTKERFGSLSILVNNAGIVRYGAATQDCSERDYRDVIEVNQIGVFLGMRSVVPQMTAAGGGSIVNVSSVAGLVGLPGLLPYVASKFAVTGMTKAAAHDLAPLGIRVHSVHPGAVDTPLFAAAPGNIHAEMISAARGTPSGRMAKPDEIADMIAFIASDACRFSTGAEFVADGGWTA